VFDTELGRRRIVEERACTLHSPRAYILVAAVGLSVKEVVSRVRHECPIAEV
jgi:hypothetical protein